MLTIYGVPISVHTRKVIVAALAKGVQHQVEPVIPFDPPPDWRELSPTGLIPAIRDGDTTLADSSVICTWLERRFPEPPLYPADIDAQARALWLEEYGDGQLFRHVVHPLFFQRVIRPNILQQATDAAAVDAVLTEAMPAHLAYLEGQADGGWLAGDFSIADITIGCNLLNLGYLGQRVDEYLYPRLAAWFGRALAHPAFKQALAAERPFAERMGLNAAFLS